IAFLEFLKMLYLETYEFSNLPLLCNLSSLLLETKPNMFVMMFFFSSFKMGSSNGKLI
ncbi:hypothetical protein L9F63_006874, partial [Diploptera punctata]